MKRGTPEHPKTHDLASRLGLEKWGAVGVIEALFHYAAAYARRGDVGRFSDAAIAKAIGWSGDAGELVAALVGAGWLDACDCHRLRVHDWPDHADQTVARTHEVKQKGFLSCYGARGAAPAPYRLPPTDPPAPAPLVAAAPVQHETSAELASDERETSQPLPTPTPEPEPTPNDHAPPGPPAAVENPARARNGPNGARTYRPGDRDGLGREVLEVDDHGRPTVVARYRDGPDAPDGLRELLTAPKLTARAEDTLARLVEYGSRVCGYRFDRQARRRLRERLVAGETEEQIRAVWDRTRAALEREPEEPDELDQALRLAGA